MQAFTDIFIKRPVFSAVLSLVLFLVGLRAFHTLPMRQFPILDTSVISISTAYAGASPNLMESYVTAPIENAIAGIAGLDYVESTSSQSSSNVLAHFKLGYDINKANTDISNAVSSVRYQLPREINDPVISKEDPNADPIIYLSFSDPAMSEVQIGDYLTRVVKPSLAGLPDVGRVDVWASEYAMRLWLDPNQMAAHSVTADDLSQALQNNNLQSAPGRLNAKYQDLNLVTNTNLKQPEEFDNLIIRANGDRLIRFSDIGKAELGAQSYNNSSVVNGEVTAILSLAPTTNGNPLAIAAALLKKLPEIQDHLPNGMKVKLLWNASKFIKASLNEVLHTIAISALCVILVISIFLGSWRAVIIPLVTIPLSLFGVSSIMLAMNYSLNTLTFLAWVLAIGLVVDDAIVVVENIYRHIEEGLSPFNAALKGTAEIASAIISMTLTLAAVYAPIGMIDGMTGVLFREFAFTLAGAVIISGLVALTLSPMMCSKLLRPLTNQKNFTAKVDKFFHSLMTHYQRALEYTLIHPAYIVILAVLIYLSCWALYRTLPSELAPSEDQGVIVSMIKGPTSANLAYTQKYSSMLSPIFNSVKDRDNYGIITGWPGGPNSGIAFLVLKPWNERKVSVDEVIQQIMPQMMQIPGISAFPFNPPPLPGSSNSSVEYVLKSMSSYEDLKTAANKVIAAAKINPAFNNIDSNLDIDQLQVNVDIDRDKANSLGINMSSVANSLSLLLGQPIMGYFDRLGHNYEIIPQLLGDFRHNPEQLAVIPLRAGNGSLIELNNIASFTQTVAPQSLPHFQQQRAITISAGVQPGYTLGQALDFLNQTVKKELPNTFNVDYTGQSRQFMESQGAMAQVFFFAIIFIFLVLAAQFESFRNPLIVMLSVPLSLFGALLVMHLAHCTMNIFTEIGLVTLIGLITKHGILIVEFAEQRLAAGENFHHSLVNAAAVRLRPILMTTAAMVLGAVPLILAHGAGSEARRQLGWVIVGGMSIGTCFTLFIIPTAYRLIAKGKMN